ncbi:hypothetical protein CONLIGDRAFT_643387 [Coniochaeta ligniaria NRRL 30616]|uniref:SGNH hydrolase-type esterase domain-containing protein n=1 Tax=Coniochaeta ligniaria NRRL 30616 TaxID=1408157 RepID=A0A1J7IVU5_9PEZI|nr:hypothetical protein CONLIGDRAFT_643387 [Coniochaeta ligniaria NRRL 30616]
MPLLRSLFKALQSQEMIKLWVVHVGANDLFPDRPFDPVPLYVLLTLIFRNSPPYSKILLTGLFYAAHVPNEYMDKVNEQYKRAVQYFGKIYGPERIQFLAAPGEFDRSIHSRKGLHLEGLSNDQLDLNGYQMWMGHLVPKMWQMLEGLQS